MTKTCTNCGEAKPHEEYHRRRASRDGLEYLCKSCKCAASADNYDSMSGVAYSRKLLRQRRRKALARIRNRNNKED